MSDTDLRLVALKMAYELLPPDQRASLAEALDAAEHIYRFLVGSE